MTDSETLAKLPVLFQLNLMYVLNDSDGRLT